VNNEVRTSKGVYVWQQIKIGNNQSIKKELADKSHHHSLLQEENRISPQIVDLAQAAKDQLAMRIENNPVVNKKTRN